VNESLIPILLGLGLALMLALAYAAYASRKRRNEAYAAFATRHGFERYADDPFGIAEWDFALFQRGDGRGVENVLHGSWRGTPVRAFDFWYYEESSDGKGHTSRSTYRFTCAVTPIEAACAHLVVDEEHLLSRLAGALTIKDIQFESEAFNRAFQVRSDDPAFAHAFIDARMISWMLGQGEGQAYEILGDKLMVVRRAIDPAELGGLLDTVTGFAEAVPRVVYSLYPRSG
jgi:hypothetical protein